jgi:hypothetical protein
MKTTLMSSLTSAVPLAVLHQFFISRQDGVSSPAPPRVRADTVRAKQTGHWSNAVAFLDLTNDDDNDPDPRLTMPARRRVEFVLPDNEDGSSQPGTPAPVGRCDRKRWSAEELETLKSLRHQGM